MSFIRLPVASKLRALRKTEQKEHTERRQQLVHKNL